MAPVDQNVNPQTNPAGQKYNPSLGEHTQKKFNPKREANTQTRNDTTGLDEELTETDQGIGEENSSSASGSVRNDDSGAV